MDSSWKNLQIRMEAAWNMRTTPKTKRPKTGDIISSAHSLDWNKKCNHPAVPRAASFPFETIKALKSYACGQPFVAVLQAFFCFVVKFHKLLKVFIDSFFIVTLKTFI